VSAPRHLVLALDDDPVVLTSLERLLGVNGHPVQVYSGSKEFFRAGPPTVPACLLLDQELGAGVTGVEVHAEMRHRGWELPTIFLTAHWDVQVVVDVMRAGADGFLTKPYDPEKLLQEVARALDRSRVLIKTGLELAELRSRADSLTPRERSIVSLVVAGRLNKEIAGDLDLALVTVKVHRGRAMHKMAASNAAELAHLAAMAGIVEGK
jgi:FixJ family two-component response regulator